MGIIWSEGFETAPMSEWQDLEDLDIREDYRTYHDKSAGISVCIHREKDAKGNVKIELPNMIIIS